MSTNSHTPPDYAAASAALSSIAHDILVGMHRKRLALEKTHENEELGLLKLDLWLGRLVPHLRLDCPTAPAYVRAIRFLHLRYHQYVILLTRSHLLLPGNSSRFGGRCEKSIRASIDILKELKARNLISDIHHQDSIFILSAGMLLFLRAAKHLTYEKLADLETYTTTLLPTTHHLRIGKRAAEVSTTFLRDNSLLLENQR
jgi:hypothetical protein